MTREETAWVAGILEGEGCFDYNRTPKYPRIRVEMVDQDVIRRLQVLIGGKTRLIQRANPKWNDTLLLDVNGVAARKVMAAVRPWLGERRGAKVDSLLSA